MLERNKKTMIINIILVFCMFVSVFSQTTFAEQDEQPSFFPNIVNAPNNLKDIYDNGSWPDGDNTNPKKLTVSEALSESNQPSKKYYNFVCWRYVDETTNEWTDDPGLTNIGTVKEYYPKWEPYKYNITYELNGGVNSENNPTEYSYNSGVISFEKPTKPNTPGAVFEGWYAFPDFSSRKDSLDTSKYIGDLTLYAKWSHFTLTFDSNGGIDGPKTSVSVPYGGQVTKYLLKDEAELPTKEEHKFNRWTKNPENTILITDLDYMTNDLTVYAEFKQNEYPLVFDKGDGIENENFPLSKYTYYIVKGSLIKNYIGSVKEEHYPTKTGHIFSYWGKKDGSKITARDVMTNEGFTVYAQFKLLDYNLILDPNSGTSGSSNVKPVTYGDNIFSALSNLKEDEYPSKTGHTFVKWSETSDGKTDIDKNRVMDENNFTVYAVYTPNDYTLEFKNDNETLYSRDDVTYGDKIKDYLDVDPAIVPPKTGYTFQDWAKDTNGTPITEKDLMTENGFTVYPYYKPNELISEPETITGKFDSVAKETSLTTTNGTGEYKYSLAENNVFPKGLNMSEDGKISGKFHDSGSFSVDIRVTDKNSGVSTIKKVIFEIEKASAPEVVFPSFDFEDNNENKGFLYGIKLKDIPLEGIGHGKFEWVDPEIIPEVDNEGYNIRFIPSDEPIITLDANEADESKNFNYGEDFEFTRTVAVPIIKADVTLETPPTFSYIYRNRPLSNLEITSGKAIGVNNEEVIGTYAWKDDTIKFDRSGTFDTTIVFTPESKNYNPLDITVSVPVRTSSSSSTAPVVYTIRSTCSDGGKISPKGKIEVYEYANQRFTFKPNPGYKISEILIDNKEVDIDDVSNSYTIKGINKNHKIYVEFSEETDSSENMSKTENSESKSEKDNTNSDKKENQDALKLKLEQKVNVGSIFNIKDHMAYIDGYPDNTFKPLGYLTRAEAAVIFSKILVNKMENKTYTSKFSDVKSNDWYNNYVCFLSEQGILNGYPDGTFKPNANITRAELVSIVAKALNINDQYTTYFIDVKDNWAKDAISAINALGWIKGYSDGTFKPNTNITRAETTSFLNAVLNRANLTSEPFNGLNIKTFKDINTNDWFYNNVIEASNSHSYEINNNIKKWTMLY